MRAIAREIGYSPAALYEYFPSKEKICCALYFEGAGGLSGRMRAALEAFGDQAPFGMRMREIALAYRRYALEVPELYQLAFGGAVAEFTPGKEEMASGKEAFQILVDVAAQGIEQGEFVDLPAEAIAIACWTGVHGFVMLELAGMLSKDPGMSRPGSSECDALYEAALMTMALGFVRR
jgi:AcrR family transcriptional regulator